MLKKLMISAAVSGADGVGAMAQANPPANPPRIRRRRNRRLRPSTAPKFVASQGADQWVFSKFKGTDVLGPDNAQIGDVNDMLFDKNGKIIAMVVGVGGFLGIGEKNVAIDMSAFQVVPADTGSTTGAADGLRTPTPIRRRQAEGVLDQGSAQERAGFRVLQGRRAAIGVRRPTAWRPRPATPPAQRQ